MESIAHIMEDVLETLQIEADQERKGQLLSYVGELERWNQRVNLTGLRRAEELVRELVADGLFLHTLIPSDGVVLDLGSGAGILAVPLAVLDRSRVVRSIDKSLRKIQFQRHVKRTLGLSNIEIFHGRAEELEPVNADILVAKAFGSVPDTLRLARPHLTASASAFLVRGSRETAPHEVAGFVLGEVRGYRLPKSPKAYQLFVYKKVTQSGVLC